MSSRMSSMSSIRRIIVCVTTVTTAAVAVVACAEDESAPRASFDSADATPDVPKPDLPKPAEDASATVDAAADAREPFDAADAPVTCAPDAGACAKEIVAGYNHFCARLADGTVRCWGDPEYGALGGEEEPPPKLDDDDGGVPDAGAAKSKTILVANLAGATQLSASRATTCARLDGGGISCWGSNSFGNLGLSTDQPMWDEYRHAGAEPVALRDTAKRVDVGPENTCAVLDDGKVWCWGTNRLAQLARPDTSLDYVMVPAEATLSPYGVARTAINNGTMFGLTVTGEIVTWGAVAGKEGFLGGRMTSISPDPMPNAIAQLSGVDAIVTSATMVEGEAGPLNGVTTLGPFPPPAIKRHAHACAIVKGEVYCWGQSDTSALCTGVPDNELYPTPAPTTGKAWAQQLALGDEITCARMTDGTIQCCGADAYGRLGTGMKDPVTPFFRPIASFTGRAVQVATSNRAVCALLEDGSVQCWGSNVHGELALGAPDDSAHPTPVKVTF